LDSGMAASVHEAARASRTHDGHIAVRLPNAGARAGSPLANRSLTV